MKKEKEDRGARPGLVHVFGIADGGVACVLDGAIIFNVAYCRVARVLHRAIAFNIADEELIAFRHAELGSASMIRP